MRDAVLEKAPPDIVIGGRDRDLTIGNRAIAVSPHRAPIEATLRT